MYRNILVAVDGSRDGAHALAHAARLAVDQHALLTILTVVPPVSGMASLGGGAGDPAAAVAEACQKTLREAAAKVPDDVGLTTLLLDGVPARRIVERAREANHDLIVLGSRGRGRLSGVLLGSTSHAVLHDSEIPVLLVHAPRGGDEEP